jgi:CBS domain-containing protein
MLYPTQDLTLRFETATVADVMHPGVLSCAPNAPAVEVARIMAACHVHAVVVDGIAVDSLHGDRLAWSVVSDLDLARAAYSGVDRLTAAEIAATEVVTVDLGTSLVEAAQAMDEHATAHLFVVVDGRPVGVVSTLDLAGALARGARQSGHERRIAP